MSESSRSVFAARGISVRALLVGSLLIIMILLLLIAVLNYVFSFRLRQTLMTMDEEMARSDMALEVDKAAADVFAALAQGTLTRDPEYFVQSVEEATQALIDAEERLMESADPLPRDDPLRLCLYGVESSSKGIRRMVGIMSGRAEDGRWQQVEYFELSEIPAYRDLMVESVERVRTATAERRAAAAVEVEDVRRTMQIVPMVVGLLIVVVVLVTAFVTVRSIARPIERLTNAAIRLAAGHLEERVRVERVDEFSRLASAFNEMADQLEISYAQLERRVAERTADLERRSGYLEASAEVGRAAASVLDPDQLIQQAVELIRERFGLYYVGLFQVDEAREWAVLRAGTGEAGRAMLARNHRIKVGAGMIGWSVAHAEARVALEAGEDGVRLTTAELPETRSEAALPLRSRGQVIGALTVQSDQSAAFDENTIVVLQTMADQVAVALDNARLFTTAQESLEAARRAYGELSRQAWIERLRTRTNWGYRYADRAIAPAEGDWRPEMLQAVQTGQNVQTDGAGEPALVIPLKVRDQVVGALSFRKDETDHTWTSEETALLETLTDQLGQALESARLFQETQRRAAREQLTSEITTRMRETLDLETVLKTAVREIREAMELSRVTVRLATHPEDRA